MPNVSILEQQKKLFSNGIPNATFTEGDLNNPFNSSDRAEGGDVNTYNQSSPYSSNKLNINGAFTDGAVT